jgi:Helix-turn-helix domain
MLTVDTQRWDQTAENLREQALRAEHHRTRERFLALYEISKGKSATQTGLKAQRNPQTVMEWVHRYNQLGPAAMVYRRSGGHPPLCPAK